jgi:hypothetical protein
VRAVYELHLNMEIEHLRIAAELMRKVEKRDPEELLPKGFERTVSFKENKSYVREVLARQVDLTAKDAQFVPIDELPEDDRYFDYQNAVHGEWVPSEAVIEEAKQKLGEEYRLETEGEHPVPGLRREQERNGESTEYARRQAA